VKQGLRQQILEAQNQARRHQDAHDPGTARSGRNQLDTLARLVPVLYPEGPAICRAYAEQATALKQRGTPIGANDLWIACHALALEATLVTHNLREFERIDGLQLADWAAD